MILYVIYFDNNYTPLIFFLSLSHTHWSSSSPRLPSTFRVLVFSLWRGVVVVVVAVVCMCEQMNFIRVTYRNMYKGWPQEHRNLTSSYSSKENVSPFPSWILREGRGVWEVLTSWLHCKQRIMAVNTKLGHFLGARKQREMGRESWIVNELRGFTFSPHPCPDITAVHRHHQWVLWVPAQVLVLSRPFC